jgi:hypothetical protein
MEKVTPQMEDPLQRLRTYALGAVQLLEQLNQPVGREMLESDACFCTSHVDLMFWMLLDTGNSVEGVQQLKQLDQLVDF